MSSNYRSEYDAFQRYITGKSMPIRFILKSLFSMIPDFFEFLFRDIPGPIGMLLRRSFYRLRLGALGKNSLIDVGVYFKGHKNIFIGDWCWIDSQVKLEALIGEIRIGKRVHVASQVIIGAREPVIIDDYAAIAAGAKIYSNSEVPKDGLHMSGPMIPEAMKAYSSQRIFIGKDALVGCNSVLLPGASLKEGAILGAQSMLKETIPAWEIWGGVPAKLIGLRSHKIEMPNP